MRNGFMINKWQIDMERSLRFNTLFFYRVPKLLCLLLLFPILVQAAESVYEQQIQQGAMVLHFASPLPAALSTACSDARTSGRLAAGCLRAGRDDEVIEVVALSRLYAPARQGPQPRNPETKKKEIKSSGNLRSRSGSRPVALHRRTTTTVSGISKPPPMPAWIGWPCRKRKTGNSAPQPDKTLRRSAYVYLRLEKADRLLWDTRALKSPENHVYRSAPLTP